MQMLSKSGESNLEREDIAFGMANLNKGSF
jgi:hypothetical protein